MQSRSRNSRISSTNLTGNPETIVHSNYFLILSLARAALLSDSAARLFSLPKLPIGHSKIYLHLATAGPRRGFLFPRPPSNFLPKFCDFVTESLKKKKKTINQRFALSQSCHKVALQTVTKKIGFVTRHLPRGV